MRWFRWACVVVGLLIGLVTVPYARTVYDVKSQTYQNLFTEAMDRKDYRAASESQVDIKAILGRGERWPRPAILRDTSRSG